MSRDTEAPAPDGPAVAARPSDGTPPRIALICTGSLNAAFLPTQLADLRLRLPRLELRIILTRSAHRFVAADAVTAVSGAR